MSLVALDVHAEDAPNGALLGTIDETDLVSLRIDLQHRGLDWIEAAIRRDSAKASLVAADRYLKLRIPMVQAAPLAGFWAKDLLYHLSSRNERGGELLKFGGPGPLWILRLARLLHTWHAPGQTARGSANKARNLWWWLNEPYGAIALRGIEEGQNQLAAGAILAPLAGVTTDFTRTVDSAAVAWTNIAGEFETRVGTDVLALEAELQQAGNFYLEAEPNLLVHAWQTYPGRDLTGSVHLQRAVNIASELARELKARHAFTHLILEDAEGSYSTETLTGFTAGRAHVGYHHAPQTSDDPLLNRIGQDVLRASRSALQAAAVDVKPGALLPGKGAGQVWKGDTVLLSSIAPGGVAGPQDYNATPVLVTGIRLTLDAAADDSTLTTRQRSLRMVLSFNEEHRLAGPSLPTPPGAGGPSRGHTHDDLLCPAFVAGNPATLISSICQFAGAGGGSVQINRTVATGESLVVWAATKKGGAPPTSPYAATAVEWQDGAGANPQALTKLAEFVAANDVAHNGDSTQNDLVLQCWHLASPTPRAGKVVITYTNDAYVGVQIVKAGAVVPTITTAAGLSAAPSIAGSAGQGDLLLGLMANYGKNVTTDGGTINGGQTEACEFPGADQAYAIDYSAGPSTFSRELAASMYWGWMLARFAGTAPSNPLNGTSILAQRCDSSEHEIAARNPTADDDADAGYPRRTIWHNSVSGQTFISTGDANGAAAWSPVAASAGMIVRRNSTGSDFERRRLNLIEGSGITIGITDDAPNDEIDVTLSAVVSAATVRDAGRWEPVIYDLGGGDGSVLMDGGSPPDALMDWRTS